jgi:hypothetical protein
MNADPSMGRLWCISSCQDPNLMQHIIFNSAVPSTSFHPLHQLWSLAVFVDAIWQFIQIFTEGIFACLLSCAPPWQYRQLI